MQFPALVRHSVLSISFGLLAIGGAAAADLGPRYTKAPPLEPVATWSGFYVGGNAGYGWLNPDGTLAGGDANQTGAFAANVYAPAYGLKSSGFVGGGQVGYNYQSGSFLVGIESDAQAANLKSAGVSTFPGNLPFQPVVSTAASNLDWFGSTRLRVGLLASPQFLVYGTGGVAYGGVSETGSASGPTAAYAGNVSGTKVGYAVGGGVEWMFARNWSIGAEYLYVNLGRSRLQENDTTLNPGSFVFYDFKHELSVARAKINYHF